MEPTSDKKPDTTPDTTPDGSQAPDAGNDREMGGFTLGKPALVCRWRLADRCLPLANRHLRALGARRLDDKPIPRNLVAWVKQHVEWTLETGSAEYPDGVLMLIVDEDGKAAMTAGEYVPLTDKTSSALVARALSARGEAKETGVAPETLWGVRGDALVAGIPEGQSPSGASSLVFGLAETVGMPVIREGSLAEDASRGKAGCDELLLVSDEHGVVPASNASGPRAAKLAAGYQRLLDNTKRKGR